MKRKPTTVGCAAVGSNADRKKRAAHARKTQRKSARKTAKGYSKSPAAQKMRNFRSKMELWRKQAENAIQVLRRTKVSSTDMENLRSVARKLGARPCSHMFDFEVGQHVKVVASPDTIVDSRVVAIRTLTGKQTFMDPYPLQGGTRDPQIIVVQLPIEHWTDKRRSGVIAVRDWQVIPIPFFGKPHKFFLQVRARQIEEESPRLSQESRSFALVPGKGGRKNKILKKVKSRVIRYET